MTEYVKMQRYAIRKQKLAFEVWEWVANHDFFHPDYERQLRLAERLSKMAEAYWSGAEKQRYS